MHRRPDAVGKSVRLFDPHVHLRNTLRKERHSAAQKKTAPLLMLSYAFYLNDNYPVLLQVSCPSYTTAAVPLSVVDCTTSVIWAVCHHCTSQVTRLIPFVTPIICRISTIHTTENYILIIGCAKITWKFDSIKIIINLFH